MSRNVGALSRQLKASFTLFTTRQIGRGHNGPQKEAIASVLILAPSIHDRSGIYIRPSFIANTFIQRLLLPTMSSDSFPALPGIYRLLFLYLEPSKPPTSFLTYTAHESVSQYPPSRLPSWCGFSLAPRGSITNLFHPPRLCPSRRWNQRRLWPSGS